MKKHLLAFVALLLGCVSAYAADTYTKVKDISTLKSGDEILLLGDYLTAGKNNPYWLIGMDFSASDFSQDNNIKVQKLAQSSTPTTVGDTYTPEDGVTLSTLIIEATNDKDYPWYFKVNYKTDKPYLNSSSSKNKVSFSAKASENSKGKFITSSNGWKIQFNKSTTSYNYFQCNLTNASVDIDKFTCVFSVYNNLNYKAFVIYKKVVDTKLGDINVTYGDDNTVVANDDIIDNIPEGTVFNFSAANATSITVTDTDNNGGTIASGTDKASWTATETSADEITVTATDGTETKTFTFTVGVVKVIPQLGDLTASYGSVQDKALTEEEVLSVYANTTITFAAANATSISYSSVMQGPKSATGNQITYVATAEDVITITALGEDNQKKEVTISVAIAAEPEKEVWSLVASLGDMPLDGQYIIVSNDGQKAMSNEVYSNYRKLTDVTVENGSLIEPSSSVLRFVVEKEGDSYLWKTLNYGGENGSNKEVYLNVAKGSDNYLLANNPISSNQGRRNTTVSFNGENVNIDFTLSERSVRYNAGSTRFATYLTSNKDMSKTENLVKLYRLGGTPMPKFTQNADGAVVFVSKAGELHIRLENRDKDGNPIVDVASSMLARAAEVEWTNKVAEESEEYVIPVPTEPVHTVYIEAKSVNNGIHSEVNKLTLNQEGTTTGIEGVEAENENAPVEYFNLQGVRVMNPAQGLYIRRQGNRVEKVAL
ncbi:MAG: hypothetical protein SO168_05890, partial [Muribaculaceae bacterium]|nr:hypothetical protein [Muribaculaceae bacterium]